MSYEGSCFQDQEGPSEAVIDTYISIRIMRRLNFEEKPKVDVKKRYSNPMACRAVLDSGRIGC